MLVADLTRWDYAFDPAQAARERAVYALGQGLLRSYEALQTLFCTAFYVDMGCFREGPPPLGPHALNEACTSAYETYMEVRTQHPFVDWSEADFEVDQFCNLHAAWFAVMPSFAKVYRGFLQHKDKDWLRITNPVEVALSLANRGPEPLQLSGCAPGKFPATQAASWRLARGLTPDLEPYYDLMGLPTLNLPIDRLLRMLEDEGIALSEFVVNFGAKTGECARADPNAGADPINPSRLTDVQYDLDPANCLVNEHGFTGIFLEAEKMHIEAMQALFRTRPEVFVLQMFVSEGTLFEFWDAADEPTRDKIREMDLFKMDIDGVQMCSLMQALATQRWFRPKLVHVEVNPHFPPPLEYATVHEGDIPDWYESGSKSEAVFPEAFHGCSLGAMQRALDKDYELLQLEHHDAVFVRSDLVAPLARRGITLRPVLDVWLHGWFCSPLLQGQPWSTGVDTRAWGMARLQSVADAFELVMSDLEKVQQHGRTLAAKWPRYWLRHDRLPDVTHKGRVPSRNATLVPGHALNGRCLPPWLGPRCEEAAPGAPLQIAWANRPDANGVLVVLNVTECGADCWAVPLDGPEERWLSGKALGHPLADSGRHVCFPLSEPCGSEIEVAKVFLLMEGYDVDKKLREAFAADICVDPAQYGPNWRRLLRFASDAGILTKCAGFLRALGSVLD